MLFFGYGVGHAVILLLLLLGFTILQLVSLTGIFQPLWEWLCIVLSLHVTRVKRYIFTCLFWAYLCENVYISLLIFHHKQLIRIYLSNDYNCIILYSFSIRIRRSGTTYSKLLHVQSILVYLLFVSLSKAFAVNYNLL